MLNLRDISKYYQSNDNIAVGLHKINLDFEAGDFVVITGESGGGKSTLLNVISGSLAYDDGELFYEGGETSWYDETDWENYRKDKISFVYQDYHLIDSFSAEDNVKAAVFVRHPDISEKQAQDMAMRYLEEVGLNRQAKNRAAQLSSGQKQRLSIARALAKETEIIVADEPTGNLDIENGRQIIEILSRLSKDKLVIMVTHNYEEAQPFATRKIKMYNGEVAEDIRLKPNQRTKEEVSREDKKAHTRNKAKEKTLSRRMARKIRRSKPLGTLMLSVLFLFLSAAIYVFYGSFQKNLDYSTAYDYLDRTYVNNDQRRLSVRKKDRTAMTEEDLKKLQRLKHVEYADLYDQMNDVVYASEQGKDYVLNKRMEITTVEIIDDSKCVKSVSGIDKKDITKGAMAENYNEAVVCSEDASLIGQDMSVYLYRKYQWEQDCIQADLTITGITDIGDEGQLYLSEPLSKQLNTAVRRLSDYTFYAIQGGNGTGLSENDYPVENTSEYAILDIPGKVTQQNPVFLKNETLSGMDMRVSKSFFESACVITEKGIVIPQMLCPTAYLFFGPSYDRSEVTVKLQEEATGHGIAMIEVSPEFYDSVYPDQSSYQISVYITDYAYTDRVIAEIEKAGYEAVSVFRAGSIKYNEKKVKEQTILLAFSFAVLVVIFIAGIFLVRRILEGRRKDYSVMMLIGISRFVIYRINLLDIIWHTITALVGTVVFVNLAMYYKVPYVASVVRYYEFGDYLVFAAIICSMTICLYYAVRRKLAA